MRRRTPLPALVVVVVGLISVLTATAGGALGPPVGASTSPTASGSNRPERIVQLGDSIASGEGTLYGYKYDTKKREWTGGNIDVKWPLPHPGCHVSEAYGRRVASEFHAAFHQFACTGATFANGITTPATSEGSTLRPAEFGNWTTQQHLNAEYDTAHPDLVLVTLGADDAQFVAIVENCIKNAYKYKFGGTEECVPSNPGSTIQRDFFSFIPTLRQNYQTLITWIDARAKAKAPGAPPPKIVFTTYANPFPSAGTTCPDVSYLYPEQTAYLSSLVDQMNAAIIGSIPTLGSTNVAVADISKAYEPGGADHRWCTNDPWAYGLSIYSVLHPSSFKSQAPFHPTPQGQQRIAELVGPTVLALFERQPPVPPSTTTTTATTSAPTTTTTLPESPTSTG